MKKIENVSAGDNMTYSIDENGIMTLTIDLTKTIGPSKSGKMEGIASTGGFVRIGESPRNRQMSINLYLGEK